MKKRILKESEWPVEVKSGSVVVKIYRTQKASGYVSYTLVYYKGSQRKVKFIQDLGEAKTEAKKIADEIAQGEQISLDWSSTERLAIQRAVEILSPLNIPIDLAAGRYAEAHRLMSQCGGDILETIRQYSQQHAGLTRKTVVEAVELYKENARAANKSDEHRRHQAAVLNRFVKSFNVDVQMLSKRPA